MPVTPFAPPLLARLASTRPLPLATSALRAGMHTRRLVLLKALLARVDSGPVAAPARRRFERDWALLEEVERHHPAAVRAVVDYPMTGAWLTEALKAPSRDAFERHLAHLGAVAAAAAVRAGHRLHLTLSVPEGTLALPGLGALRCPTGLARLSVRPGLVRISGTGRIGGTVLLRRPTGTSPGLRRAAGTGRGWAGLRTLPGSTVVLDDLDPYRAPPRGVGQHRRLAAGRSDAGYQVWAQRWRGARLLLAAADAPRAAETGAVLQAVVPMATCGRGDDGALMSATLRAAPGAVLTSLPAGAPELAEVLVHEAHHTKMTALQELVPLCHPGPGLTHPVGWRPDPRPVPGVLQGAYAHLALLDLWRRTGAASGVPEAWRRGAREKFESYRAQVGEALSILLESDELTFAGREFVTEMGKHHASLGTASRVRR